MAYTQVYTVSLGDEVVIFLPQNFNEFQTLKPDEKTNNCSLFVGNKETDVTPTYSICSFVGCSEKSWYLSLAKI